MPAIEPLFELIGIDLSSFKKEEKILLEARLFTHICDELKKTFSEEKRKYFRLLKLPKEQEDFMIEAGFVHSIIKDILSTGEYDLKGIAEYTDTFEEVVEEFVTGRNINPSAIFLRRLINLHSSVRRELYNLVISKVIEKYVKTISDLSDIRTKESICSEK